MRDLGARLREAFRRNGMTRNALSKQSGVGYNAVHRFFAGDADVTLRTASKMADVLGLDLTPVRGKGKR